MKKGFTFVETMVVLALFGILGVSLFSSFSMGMKVWKKATSANRAERKAVLALERFASELRRAINYTPIGFFGERSHVEFASMFGDKIYNISYDLLSENKTFMRSAMSRQEMLELEENTSAWRLAIPEVKDLNISYYGADNQTGNYTFLERWNYTASGMPMAVRVSVLLENNASFEKIVEIPIAQ